MHILPHSSQLPHSPIVDNRLNANLKVISIDHILDVWLKKSVENIHWQKSSQEQKRVYNSRKIKLTSTWKQFQEKYKSERSIRVKPIGFAMDAKTYLFYCLDRVTKELSLNMEDDSALQEKFAAFRQDLYEIRYNDKEGTPELERCVAFIGELLVKFEEIGQESYSQELKPYLEVCRELLHSEDLFELNLNTLFCGGATCTTVPVEALRDAFHYSLETLKGEGIEALNRVEQELLPYLGEKQSHFYYANTLHALLVKKREEIAKSIEMIRANSPIEIAKERHKVGHLGRLVEPLCQGFLYRSKERSFANNQMYADIFREMVKRVEGFKIEEAEVDWDKVFLLYNRTFDFPIGNYTLKSFRKIANFQSDAFRWHCAINGAVTAYTANLEAISIALHSWLGNRENLLRRLLEARAAPAPAEGKVGEQLPVDQFVKKIEGIRPPKRRKKKSPQQRNKRQTGRKEQNAEEKSAEVLPLEERAVEDKISLSQIPPSPSPPPLTTEERVFAAVETALLNNKATANEKIAARQGLMYLKDLLAIERCFRENRSAAALIMKVHASYMHIEQLLRLKNLQQRANSSDRFAFHNLQHQATPLGRNGDAIVYELRMANAWVPDTYMQMERWSTLREFRFRDPPDVLKALYRAHEGENDANRDECPSLREALEFSSSLFASGEKRRGAIELIDFSLPEAIKFNRGQIKKIAGDVGKLSATLPHSELKLAVKQLSKNLLLAHRFLGELSRNKVPSDSFSLLVRHTLYWCGQSMEKALRALLIKEERKEWKKCHNLHEMYREIFLKEGAAYSSLREKWHNWNNHCRYPYEKPSPENWLHETILAAEQLRDAPHLNENFIEISHTPPPKELLSVNAIIKRVESASNELVALFASELLPRLFIKP